MLWIYFSLSLSPFLSLAHTNKNTQPNYVVNKTLELTDNINRNQLNFNSLNHKAKSMWRDKADTSECDVCPSTIKAILTYGVRHYHFIYVSKYCFLFPAKQGVTHTHILRREKKHNECVYYCSCYCCWLVLFYSLRHTNRWFGFRVMSVIRIFLLCLFIWCVCF